MRLVKPKKFLGQHFLKDLSIAQDIANTVDVCPELPILEVGPGMGVLTQFLLTKQRPVKVVELDFESVAYLKENFPSLQSNNIIECDFLKMNLEEVFDGQPFVLTGNYPYNISSQIFFKMLDYKNLIPCCTGMIQKEVAQRITADPGDKLSGAITYSVNYYAIPEEIIVVESDSFIPAPEVDSEVIKLYIRNIPAVNVIDEKMFFNIIKASFMQRRKTLLNSLTNFGITRDKEKLKEVLTKAEIDETMRGERLTIEQFAKLSNLISKSI